jgi:hypothetical protein
MSFMKAFTRLLFLPKSNAFGDHEIVRSVIETSRLRPLFMFLLKLGCLVLGDHTSTYIHTYHSRFIPEGVAEASQIFLRDAHVLTKLALSNTVDVTGGKPIAVWSQSISGANAINPLVAYNDIHGRQREVLFFYFVPDTTPDMAINEASLTNAADDTRILTKVIIRVGKSHSRPISRYNIW